MKSIANQYRDLKEGRMSQANFMRNLRMTMPQYITNVTSFKDSVRILKNKGILTEAYANEAPFYNYNGKKLYVDNQSGEPDAPGGTVSLYDENNNEYKGIISSIDREGMIYVDEKSIEPNKANDEAYPEDYDDSYPTDYDNIDDYNDGEFWEAKDGDDDAEVLAMLDKIAAEKEGEEAVMGQYDESLNEAKKEKVDADHVHPNELSMGIKVEMEHTDDPEKAKKIALDHLAENPFYYTELKLSGVDTKKTTSTKEKKAIAKKKDETELVDKANQMKPVKGVEKAKASANKANKETNKPVKGISLMSLIAKTSKGVQKMAATGEKMKVVKEGYEEFVAQKKSEETAAETFNGFKRGDKVMIDPDAAKATGLKAGKVYTIKDFRTFRKGSMLQNTDAMLDNGEEINVEYIFKAPKIFTSPTNLGKYDLGKLTELIQEVIAEMNSNQQETDDIALGIDETFDGRDNLTDVTGENK